MQLANQIVQGGVTFLVLVCGQSPFYFSLKAFKLQVIFKNINCRRDDELFACALHWFGDRGKDLTIDVGSGAELRSVARRGCGEKLAESTRKIAHVEKTAGCRNVSDAFVGCSQEIGGPLEAVLF